MMILMVMVMVMVVIVFVVVFVVVVMVVVVFVVLSENIFILCFFWHINIDWNIKLNVFILLIDSNLVFMKIEYNLVISFLVIEGQENI